MAVTRRRQILSHLDAALIPQEGGLRGRRPLAVTRRRQRHHEGGAVAVQKCECDGEDGKGCQNPPIPGTYFCQKHQSCPLPPLTGYEPDYTPHLYNRDPAVQSTHNCLMYAVLTNIIRQDLVKRCRDRNLKNCRDLFYQPGEASGQRNGLDAASRRTCPVVESLLTSDNERITKTRYRDRCPAGTSKIAIAVDPKKDYHVWVQTKDGAFPDKPGEYPVVRRTMNPEHAIRDYGDIKYVDFCGFYCVPRVGLTRLGPDGAISLPAAAAAQRPQQGGAPRGAPQILARWQQGGHSVTLWSQSPLQGALQARQQTRRRRSQRHARRQTRRTTDRM